MIEAILTPISPPARPISLLNLDFDPTTWQLALTANAIAVTILLAVLLMLGLLLKGSWFGLHKQFEMDEAEIGVGSGKVKFRPNLTDRQVAYAIWVELSTRKIGLEIDLKDDVVSEIYDSWYQFFGVTRDLLKTVPVQRVSDPSTRKIIHLSISILNEGLRPHLTTWQARFRRWFDRQMIDDKRAIDPPQLVQAEFPAFADMTKDLLEVNRKLIAYRQNMKRLVYGE
jgi:hypothetical protein